MKNKKNLPRFTAEASICQKTTAYFSDFFDNANGAAVIHPQRVPRHVTTACGPCIRGRRFCHTSGFECRWVPGFPGNADLDLRPSGGHIECELVTINTWFRSCGIYIGTLNSNIISH
jgi:hypothetical protein